MREIVHIQAGQCGNQIGTKVRNARGVTVTLTEDPKKASGLCPSLILINSPAAAPPQVHLFTFGEF